MSYRRAAMLLALSIGPGTLFGQTTANDKWRLLDRLIGTWKADSESGGQPGIATRGGETWRYDLDGNVLIRRYYSEYAATAQRAAFRHEGMTVIVPGRDGRYVAHDFDNEGHAIDYDVALRDSAIVLTSLAAEGAPSFRLTLTPRGDGYDVLFELGPRGAQSLKPYVRGGLRRVSAAP